MGAVEEEQSESRIEISATTFQMRSAGSFGLRDPVRVVVVDLNPFLFDYRIEAESRPIAEASIAEFFSGVMGISLPTVTRHESTREDLVALVTKVNLFTANPCEDAAVPLITRIVAIEKPHDLLREAFSEANTISNEIAPKIAEKRRAYLHPLGSRQQLEVAATEAADTLVAASQRLAVKRSVIVGELNSYLGGARAVSQAVAAVPAAQRGCREVVEITATAHRLANDTLSFKAGLDAITLQIQTFNEEADRLLRTARDPERFRISALLPEQDRPTNVTIRVLRKPAGTEEPFSLLRSTRLNFGGHGRKSFSAGLALATLRQNEFGTRAIRLAPNGTSADTVASLITRTRSAGTSAFPMITFNTRLIEVFRGSSAQFVLGVGTNDLTKPRIGFLMGLGLDAFGERVVLSGGALIAEETRLAAGLEVGDRIFGAEGLATERHVVIRPTLAVTYRVF